MTTEELDFLMSQQAREAIEQYIDADPALAAMKLRKEFGSFASTIATQIKYLARAKTKIPLFYQHRCIIEPLAFEQSSSGAVSEFKTYSGELCIDLTCGLGVDVVNFAGRFDRVITIERNEILVAMARHNFKLLGIANVELVHGSSDDYIVGRALDVAQGRAPRADLLYVDPARRDDQGKKTVGFAACSPDVVPLMGDIETCAKRVVVKCSPLFEISEIFAVFGQKGVCAEVVSSRGECKEVVVDKLFDGADSAGVVVRSTELGCLEFDNNNSEHVHEILDFCPPYKYLLLPDVSIYKARMVEHYIRSLGAYVDSQNGYGFSNSCPRDFFGRVFEIESMEEFKARKIKKDLSEQGIKRLTIMQHNSPLSNQSIAKSLGVSIGGSKFVAVSEINHENYIVFLGKKI